MFFKFGTELYNINQIKFFSFYMKKGKMSGVPHWFTARIYWANHTEQNPQWSEETGQAAIDLAVRFGPQVLEGNSEFKFAKRAWMFHNFIAHPIMQLLALFGLSKLGLKIHDATIPRPKEEI